MLIGGQDEFRSFAATSIMMYIKFMNPNKYTYMDIICIYVIIVDLHFVHNVTLTINHL